MWHVEDYARLEPLATEYLELARKLGDRSATADALLLLARTALHHADHARAAALSEESLALSRAQRDKVAAVRAMVSLADVAVQQGMPDRADALYREGLVLAAELGDRWWFTLCLEGMVACETSRSRFTRAATLLGAAAELRKAIGSQHPAPTRENRFTEAWARGRAMNQDDLVAFALEA